MSFEEKKERKMTSASAVAWFYQGDSGTTFAACGEELSAKLETAFSQLTAAATIEDAEKLRYVSLCASGCGEVHGTPSYLFDFVLMLQRNESSTKIRPIKRFAVPRHVTWLLEAPAIIFSSHSDVADEKATKAVPLTGYSAALVEYIFSLRSSKMEPLVLATPDVTNSRVDIKLDDDAISRCLSVDVASLTVEGSPSAKLVRRVQGPHALLVAESVAMAASCSSPTKRGRSTLLPSEDDAAPRASLAPSLRVKTDTNAFRLLFPSISTNIFMFDVDRAAAIACGLIHKFLSERPVHTKPNELLRLTLIDAPRGPDTLTIAAFKKAWAKVNKSGETRLTFVTADVGNVKERGQCGYIANAANESFSGSPATGGFNRALFEAAGWRQLQADSRAKFPDGAKTGECYDVELRPNSPLRAEGVRRILHVVGPNMNHTRPNYIADVGKASTLLARSYENLLSRWSQLVLLDCS